MLCGASATPEKPLDGLDARSTISQGKASPRTEALDFPTTGTTFGEETRD